MTDDTTRPLHDMGDTVAILLDGLLELLHCLRRTGHADATRAEDLVGLANEAGDICGQLELAYAEAQATTLTQDAIRRASGRGVA